MDLTDEELLFYYGQIMVKPTITPKTSVVRLRRRGAMLVQGCDVYIGRKQNRGGWQLSESIWANPFTVKSCGSNAEACRRYEAYIRYERPDLMARLSELQGKVLGCWCDPAPCHGHVLLKLLHERKLE